MCYYIKSSLHHGEYMKNALFLLVAAALVSTPVLGQEMPFEPVGQTFTPPATKIVRTTGQVQPVESIKAACAADLAQIYEYRDRLYLKCLRTRLGGGYTVIDLTNTQEIVDGWVTGK